MCKLCLEYEIAVQYSACSVLNDCMVSSYGSTTVYSDRAIRTYLAVD